MYFYRTTCRCFVSNVYLLFEIDGIFTEVTMLIHAKCLNYAYAFHDGRQRDFIAYMYPCRYIYYRPVQKP